MALHVLDEANRCLGCKKPMCQQGCPIHTNIPEVIRLLKDNHLDDAGRMLFENNPLTTVCSLVCNHENQCEGHCIRNRMPSHDPVHFSIIEDYISTTYANKMTSGPAPKNGMKAAVVGSGPAGLTVAVLLARWGYDVTIFDARDKIGGVMRYGIPNYRLPDSVLDDFQHRHLEPYMPGVTGEMLDWWFPWHSVGSDLRYKIWDPEDHYFARAYPASYVVDPNVPMNQKTWGVDHYIMEDVGPGPEFLKLCFKRPADFGYDESIIGTEKCESLVCAIGESSCAAAMTHKWHPYKDGVLFESRFWIGYRIDEEGNIVKAIPEGVSIPPFVPQGLFAHNIKEFTNLAAILPTLYAEEKDTF